MKSSPRFVKYNRLFVISFNCFTPTFVLASRIDPLKMFHFLVEKYSWINIGITDLVVLQSVGIEENFETILTWCMSRAENRTKNNVIPNLFAETLFRFCSKFRTKKSVGIITKRSESSLGNITRARQSEMRIDSSCSASKWPRNMVADGFHFRETDARMHICSSGSSTFERTRISENLVHHLVHAINSAYRDDVLYINIFHSKIKQEYS